MKRTDRTQKTERILKQDQEKHWNTKRKSRKNKKREKNTSIIGSLPKKVENWSKSKIDGKEVLDRGL